MGIDYGSKRVGVAFSDEAGTMGFPHDTLPNDERLLENVLALIAGKDAGAVVIGASRNLSGEANPIAKEAEAFGKALAEDGGVPVFFEDERFSTQEALRFPDGVRGKKDERTDAKVAALLLTNYLERHDNN
jgi:putative Holliday junction resolvase